VGGEKRARWWTATPTPKPSVNHRRLIGDWPGSLLHLAVSPPKLISTSSASKSSWHLTTASPHCAGDPADSLTVSGPRFEAPDLDARGRQLASRLRSGPKIARVGGYPAMVRERLDFG
jgi:hypothetical protein